MIIYIIFLFYLGKYVGNRPIKLRKSSWKDRNMEIVKKKEAEKAKMGFK
jgi:hypothetical protein